MPSKGLREAELRAIAGCTLCGRPFGHTGLTLFWRVRLERYGVDREAVQRQAGLAMALGGRAGLAMTMGPDEVMARVFSSMEVTVCEECAVDRQVTVAMLGLSEED